MDIQEDILKFWFEETQPAQWFQKSDAFDAAIKERFFGTYEKGAGGDYDSWQENPRGALALIILLDQMPRNMFRDTPQAFATDAKALAIAKHTIAQGFDQELPVQQRRFIYLPYEHSEALVDQEEAVKLFGQIKNEDPLGYEYAIKHMDVIIQFGRFPHRNAILNRDSTPEEQKYLAQPGAGF